MAGPWQGKITIAGTALELDLAMNQDWPALEAALGDIAQQQIAALSAEQKAALGDANAVIGQQVAAT